MTWSDTLREREVIESCRQRYYDQMAGLDDDDYDDDDYDETEDYEDEDVGVEE